jgi:hypothetical protein
MLRTRYKVLIYLSWVVLLAAAFIVRNHWWQWERLQLLEIQDDLNMIRNELKGAALKRGDLPASGGSLADAVSWSSRFPVPKGHERVCFMNLGSCSEPEAKLGEKFPQSYLEFAERWRFPRVYNDAPMQEDIEIGIGRNGSAQPIYRGYLLSPFMTPYIYLRTVGQSGAAVDMRADLVSGDGIWSRSVGRGAFVYSVGGRMVYKGQRATVVVVIVLCVVALAAGIAGLTLGYRGNLQGGWGAWALYVVICVTVWCACICFGLGVDERIYVSGASPELPSHRYYRNSCVEYKKEMEKLYKGGLVSKAEYDAAMLASQYAENR